jgi:cytoskeleton protein RodZ
MIERLHVHFITGMIGPMEEILPPIQGSKGPTPPQVSIGERLRSARKSLRLSEKEAASRLNLTVKVIDIMETEDFHKGPPATFMRGYLRSYGRLLNFNENEINIAIQEFNLTLPPTVPSLSSTLQKKEEAPQLDRYLRWSSYFVISLLLGLVVIWWTSHPRFNEAEILSKQAPETTSAMPTPVSTVSASVPLITPTAPPPNTTLTTPTPNLKPPIASTIPAPAMPPIKPTNLESVNDIDADSGENIY